MKDIFNNILRRIDIVHKRLKILIQFIPSVGTTEIKSAQKKPSHPTGGTLALYLEIPGNPAVFVRPVAFRPPITRGLAYNPFLSYKILTENDRFVKIDACR